MKNQYYDTWEFNKMIKEMETNPFEAKAKFENYLSNYPNDISAQIYYAIALTKIGEFKQAEYVINYTEQLLKNEHNIEKNQEFINRYKKDIVTLKMRLLSLQERHKEMYNYYLKHQKYINTLDEDIGRVLFYCKKKLGKLDLNRRDKNSYIFRQIVEYKENDFIEHIQRHIADSTAPSDCIFVSSFPFEKVLEEIKKHIPCDKRTYPGNYDNQYVFKYDGCGKINNKSTNYFKVICFHNTKDIITMYPAIDCEKLPCIDLNYLNQTLTQHKVKKLSQIDKFNQRYKK